MSKKPENSPGFKEFHSTHTIRITPIDVSGKKTIPTICPWCNKIFKLDQWDIEEDRKIGATHGICPKCFEKYKQEFIKK